MSSTDWYSGAVGAFGDALGGGFDSAPPVRRQALGRSSSAFQSNPFASRSSSYAGNPFAGSARYSPDRGNPFSTSGRRGDLGYSSNIMLEMDALGQQRMAKRMAEAEAAAGYGQGPMPGGGGGQAGAYPGLGNGRLDQFNQYFNQAAAKTGAPANLIKAIIYRESSGDWNRDGHRYVYLPSRGHNVLAFSGITDPAAKSWGYNPQDMIGNAALQIEAVGTGLARLYQAYGSQYGWDGVIAAYYSGDPTAKSTPGDSIQHGTTAAYLNTVKSWWQGMDSAGGYSGGYEQGGGGQAGISGGLSAVWGNGNFQISQDHGPSAFSEANFDRYYRYSLGLGMRGHPGIDVAMPQGTALYSPVSGRVVAAGGTGSYNHEPAPAGNNGELRIMTDNGHIVILGHMANIQVGQRVTAGQYVGTSGIAGTGGHLHLEVRIPGQTSTGWQAVDPKSYFSGTSLTTSFGGTMGNYQTPVPQQSYGGAWWQRPISQLFG